MEATTHRQTTPDGAQVVHATVSRIALAAGHTVSMDFDAPDIGIHPGGTMVRGDIQPPLPHDILAFFGGTRHRVRLRLENPSSHAFLLPPLTITWVVTDVRII